MLKIISQNIFKDKKEKKFEFMVTNLAMMLVFSIIGGFIVSKFNLPSGSNTAKTVVAKETIDYVREIISTPLFALMEELIFRQTPLLIMCLVMSIKLEDIVLKEPYKLMLLMILSSVIFGYCHGSIYNVLIQGVGGLILFYTYVYSAIHFKIKNWTAPRVGLVYSTALHTFYNWSVFLIVNFL